MKIKLCIMSAFLSVLLLFSNLSVKANNVTSFPAFPEPVEGKSSTHYLIVYYKEEGYYYLFKPLNPNSVYAIKDTSEENRLTLSFNEPAIVYKLENNNWVRKKIIDNPSNYHFFCYFDENLNNNEFLYSSFNIYYNDDELFFQRAPIKANFLTQMRGVEMGAILRILVSLIPLLLGLVVSFLAFRKAWSWLSKVLRKA